MILLNSNPRKKLLAFDTGRKAAFAKLIIVANSRHPRIFFYLPNTTDSRKKLSVLVHVVGGGNTNHGVLFLSNTLQGGDLFQFIIIIFPLPSSNDIRRGRQDDERSTDPL